MNTLSQKKNLFEIFATKVSQFAGSTYAFFIAFILAIQLKLNELVAAHEFASNRMVCVEDMTEEELKTIKKYYSKLNELSVNEQKLQQTHSIDEAYKDNEFKKDLEGHISNLINKSTNPSNHGYINQKKLGKELIWRK